MGKGNAQAGELKAIILTAQYGAKHIYADLYAGFKGNREWIGHWTASNCPANRLQSGKLASGSNCSV